MEKGYYKPETDEFCEGFEYEVQEKVNGEWKKRVTEDLTGSQGSPGGNASESELYEIFYRYLPKDQVRVKILNLADIKAEGFSPFSDLSDKYLAFIKIINESNWQLWWFYNESKIVIKNGGETQFSGTIRNNTEFRELLKQLGI